MSLTAAQRAATAAELNANLERSGLTMPELVFRSRLTSARVVTALAVSEHADPEDVWRVRDVVEAGAYAAGAVPVPFSVLTEDMRASAQGRGGTTH